jgi:VanZ family protein
MMDKPPLARARTAAIWLTALTIALATMAFLMPLPEMPDDPIIHDKLAHALIFFTMALPALVVRLIWWPWLVLVALVYGALIEVIQPLTGRSFDLGDLAANLAGVALALVVAPLLRRVLVQR